MDVLTKQLQGYTTLSKDPNRTAQTLFMSETPTVTAVFPAQLSCTCDMWATGIPFSCLQSLLIQVFIRKSPHAKQWLIH